MRTAGDRSAGPHESSKRHRPSPGRRILALGSAVVTTVALTLLGSALPAAAAGTTWYVDQANGADSQTCGDSAGPGACMTIGAALARTADGDIVSIASGDYSETLTVTDAITLQGDSQTGVVLSNPSTADEPTLVIDADGLVTIAGMTIMSPVPPDTSTTTVTVRVEAGRTATLSQVTVTTAPDSVPGAIGVIAGRASTLTLDRSTVTGFAFFGVVAGGDLTGEAEPEPATLMVTSSSVSDNGGGIALLAGTATVIGGTVSGNTFAGLMTYTANTAFHVSETSITGNGSSDAGSFAGGVVLQSGGTFTGNGVTISGNSVGVMAGGGDIGLTDSVLKDNGGTTDNDELYGAAIQGQQGFDPTTGDPIRLTVTIIGTEVSDNSAGLRLNDATQARIEDSTIADNTMVGISLAVGSGGITTDLTVTDSSVTGNGHGVATVLTSTGAGMLLTATDAVVTDTDISGNLIGVAGNGDTHLTITGGTVSDNTTGGMLVVGSGTSENDASFDVTGTSITGNGLAPGPYPWAAGITLLGGSVVGKNVTISGNLNGILAGTGAADAELTLTDSVVSDSVMADHAVGLPTGNGIVAGGTDEQGARITVDRTEVSGNEANGVWLLPGAVAQVGNSTVAGNAATGITSEVPAGMDPPSAPPAQLLLAAGTVADNTAGGLVVASGLGLTLGGSIVQAPDGAPACAGDVSTLVDGGNNLASDDSCGLDAGTSSVGDPLLGALADNGGRTRTMLPDPASAVVNAIQPGASVSLGELTVALCGDGTGDQRGTARPQGTTCDIGAVERTTGMLTVTASDATLYQGRPEPEVTASYTGFAGNDTAADLDTPPTCGFDEAAGITSCSGAADDFYRFSYVPGVLTVLQPPEIGTDSLPGGQVGVEYSASVTASGGAEPLTWSATGLPAGLTLHQDGSIDGTPSAGGPYPVTVTVSDANSVTAEQQLMIRIDAPACTAAPFPDVPVDDPDCPAIAWTSDRHITSGYTDGLFHPEGQVTRQTMAAFLYRYAHQGDSAPACTDAPFADVPASNPFCGAISWLVEQGVASGYGDGTYRPTEPVTNQTMAAFLYRLDHDGSQAPACTQAPFADVPKSNPFCGAISWVTRAGIAIGGPDGFGPTETVTRGPMATILYYYDGYRQAVIPQ
ncbi:MAG TPA: S-layer homology domain-containing protein [Nakamurella sp.]|nr:S-layer homology domain-containing protein [Nakamurella sp.]